MRNTAIPLLALSLTACMANQPGGYGPPPDQGTPPMMEPYRAIGNEPFWSLDVDERTMRFTTADGFAAQDDSYAFTPDRRLGDVYQGQRIRATVLARECSDTMSDRVYPHTVTVEIATQVWRGCGAPARFYQSGWESGAPGTPPRYENEMGYASSVLANTRWRIVSLNGAPTPAEGDFFLNFDDRNMQARFDCNRFTGDYRLDGNRLKAGPMAATRMACPNDSAERAGADILSQPMTIRMEGAVLNLSNNRGTIRATRSY